MADEHSNPAQPLALLTPAWQLLRLGQNRAGVLELVNQLLAFTTKEGRVFEAPLSSFAVDFPWYYFGGGVKLALGDERHRISFTRPNGAEYWAGRGAVAELPELGAGGELAGAGFGLLSVGAQVHEIGSGRRAGRQWKRALAAGGL